MEDKNNRAALAAELRRQAEELYLEKSPPAPENPAALRPGELQRVLHELGVHQIELELQNEELRRAQAELDAQRARYFDLYDLAPVGYLTVSGQGLILEANLTAGALLGMARGVLAQRPVGNLILKDDQDAYYLHRKLLLATGEPQAFELRLVKTDGTAFWARLDAALGKDAAGADELHLVITDIAERRQAEDITKASLAEKEVLLKEIHHRVKNNLQVVSSLLNLQAKAIKDEAARSAFSDSRARIRAMALVHEILYRSRDLASLNPREYVGRLLEGLAASCNAGQQVQFAADICDCSLSADILISLGLILSELVSNAYKHAFAGGRQGVITISLAREAAGYCLSVEDGGPGLPAGYDLRAAASMGLQLVTTLAGQLSGTAEVIPGAGARFLVRFPG